MVSDTRKALHPDALKPVNLPQAVAVQADDAGNPTALKTGRWQTVGAVEDSWRIDDEWWRPRPTARRYFAVRLAEGRRLVIFQDLVDGNWYRQSY